MLLTTKKTAQQAEFTGEKRMNNHEFAEREQRQQQLLMKQQDQQMNDVAYTVAGIKEMAIVIGDELDDQTK